MSDASPPPAGWYPDPENPSGQRWWNGSGWSDQKRAAGDAASTGFVYGSTAEVRPNPYASSAATDSGYGASRFAADASANATPYGVAPPAATTPAPPAYTAPAYTSSPYVAPYGARPAGSTNGLALAGLIVSAGGWIILGVFASITGIVLSAVGLAKAKKLEAEGNPNSGRGMAMAGIVIGIVVTLLGLILVGAYVAFMISVTNTSVYDY